MLADDADKYASRKTVGSGLTGLSAFAASMGEIFSIVKKNDGKVWPALDIATVVFAGICALLVVVAEALNIVLYSRKKPVPTARADHFGVLAPEGYQFADFDTWTHRMNTTVVVLGLLIALSQILVAVLQNQLEY